MEKANNYEYGYNYDDQLCFHYLSLLFKYIIMIFRMFFYIFYHLRVYYELTNWPTPRWLDSSVVIALHSGVAKVIG